MSLADELLADLEEAAEEEENFVDEEDEPAIEDVQEEMQLDLSVDSVKSIAKLWDSKMFAEIMVKIEEYISKQSKATEVMGPVEAAPEYRVIVDANNLTVEIENELSEWPALWRALLKEKLVGWGCRGCEIEFVK
ncbi:U4/U6 small nuclear ribonucleoprotein Prp31 [Eretmochelys imbricata]